MHRIWSLLLLLLFGIIALKAERQFADLEGDYCRKRIGGCCPGRLDECATPILGTLCYCDSFCNRTDNSDCCPDYWEFCLGELIAPPPEDVRGGCFDRGVHYPAGSTRKINCNQCKCEYTGTDPTPSSTSSGRDVNGKWEFLCERDACMVDPSIVETVNEGDFGWTGGNHSEFWGRKLSDGILRKLGTLEPQRALRRMLPVMLVYDERKLPRSFDARKKWPGLIGIPKDQGWCGSDWALTAAGVLGDRLGIMSKGVEKLALSPQHLVSCTKGNRGCKGGGIDRVWNFLRRFGVVDEECYPYEGDDGTVCRIPRSVKSLLDLGCQSANRLGGRKELFRSQPPYRVAANESDIRYEIQTNGPVHGVMAVHPDFFTYKRGIYRRTGFQALERTGYHSVRIIGWGEEFITGKMVKYWLVSNSWGVDWGEEGFFRIVRGENECEIESFVVAGWARPSRQLLIEHNDMSNNL